MQYMGKTNSKFVAKLTETEMCHGFSSFLVYCILQSLTVRLLRFNAAILNVQTEMGVQIPLMYAFMPHLTKQDKQLPLLPSMTSWWSSNDMIEQKLCLL